MRGLRKLTFIVDLRQSLNARQQRYEDPRTNPSTKNTNDMQKYLKY